MIDSVLVCARQGAVPFSMNFSGISLTNALRLLISLSATICCLPRIVDEFTGRVVGGTDGDTITLSTTEENIKLRLSGNDAPERGRPFGTKAKQALLGQLFGNDVTIDGSGGNRCGTTLCEIIMNGEGANVWLVRGDWDLLYERYAPDDTQLRDAKQETRKTGRGLWTDPAPAALGLAAWEALRGYCRVKHG